MLNIFVAEMTIADAMDSIKDNSALSEYLDGALMQVLDFAITVILAIVVFLVGSKLIKLVTKFLKKSMEKANAEHGVVTFVSSLCKYSLYFVLILVILSHFGVTASSVIAVLGSAGLTLGLALQGSLSNFAGGVLILLLKPFVVGDYIIENTDKQEGVVSEISIFYTKLLTIDNKAIMIPNGTLSNSSVVNVTAMDKRRLDMRINVAYDTDVKQAREILERVVLKDAAVLVDEDKSVFVAQLGEGYMTLGVRAWVKASDFWPATWRANENVKNAFDEAGIKIPFPQMEVTMKN